MTDHRLSRHAVPQAYRITLDASPKRSRFSGQVAIDVVLKSAPDFIELHARALRISRAVLVIGGKRLAAEIKLHKARETVALHFNKPLGSGRATLELTYEGVLDKALHGLYLAQDGSDRAIVSQCEATDARAIFPCWDEPEFKATLQWTIKTDPGLMVVTNGVLDTVSKSGGRTVHTFKKTRIVSTYLAAVTMGTYEASKPERIAGVPHRVVTGVGRLAQAEFAKEVTRFVLPWYEKYFGQKYHYQKLDQVAVSGFDAGAMENIGAIFYRQSRFLMNPGQTSWATQKSIAEVVAHEVAHQWFGNRVTMKWWDDLWLNEAFATWVAFKVVDVWKPQWRLWDDYQDGKERALFADALVSTHPIYTPVKSPAEATELFDVITYEKGGSVLRMLERYLGEAVFQKGIARYMDMFKDKNAAGDDLWHALEEASGQPVSTLMSSWVKQPGFPLLQVTASDRGGSTRLRVSQKRFFSSAEQMREPGEQKWAVPMVVRYSAAGRVYEERFLIEEREQTIELSRSADWIYPNAEAVGFYRVQLDSKSLSKVLSQGVGQAKGLRPAERLGLVEDQWALVRNGLSNIGQFLKVLSALRGERDYIVLQAMCGRLRLIEQRLLLDKDRKRFKAFVSGLLQPSLDAIGFKVKANEKTEVSVARATVVDALGRITDDAAVLKFARACCESELVDPGSVEPNLASVVVSLAAHSGNAKQLERFVKTFVERRQAKASPELQGRYLGALTSFRGEALNTRVLSLCLDGTVPQEQLRSLIAPLLGNRSSNLVAWNFLKKNWAKIGPRVGAMGVSRLVEATGALPPELAKDVKRFFTKNKVAEAERALKKALEAMSLNAELIAREAPGLGQWLRANE